MQTYHLDTLSLLPNTAPFEGEARVTLSQTAVVEHAVVAHQPTRVIPLLAVWEEQFVAVSAWAEAHPDAVTQEEPKPEPTLEEAQQSQIQTINSAFTEAVASTKYNVPEDEVLTWDIQKLEAQAWELNSETATPFIDGIAEARGIDRVELIEKVLLKVAAYKAHVSTQVGKRQGYEDAIYAATTNEEVYAIVWEED